MRGGVFSRLAHRIAAIEGERYPLHVGDTWMEPAIGAHLGDLQAEDHPGMHRYTLPQGLPDLLSALSERRGIEAGRILISGGATTGLGAVAAALMNPGDEVLLLSPYWPLIRGIVQINRGTPVEVPFYDRPNSPDELIGLLEARCTDRTVAVYVNTPNNPTGRVLTEDQVRAIVDFARSRDLWIWADEVYEDYAYTRPHVAIGAIAPERTFAAYSFSKAYGMAGNRCGYVIGPDVDTMTTMRRASTHYYYCAPHGSQLAAARVLTCGDEWLVNAKSAYRQSGNAAADTLGVPRPEGGTFLFIDVADHLDESGLHGFLVHCIDRGLILAPGSSCGADYATHIRLCFTSAPPDVIQRGTQVLAQILDPT
jgi:aspartate/methionine/tyrosine aminotransferase